jgi:hypothetical protein
VKRWLVVIVLLGCSKKAQPAPAPAPVDPFNAAGECQRYLKRAQPALEDAVKAAASNDMTNAQPLREQAAAMGKARTALGVEPSVPTANAHYKKSLATLDGLQSAFSTLAASREPNAPANPEVPLVANKAMVLRKQLDDVVKTTPSICDAVK